MVVTVCAFAFTTSTGAFTAVTSSGLFFEAKYKKANSATKRAEKLGTRIRTHGPRIKSETRRRKEPTTGCLSRDFCKRSLNATKHVEHASKCSRKESSGNSPDSICFSIYPGVGQPRPELGKSCEKYF